MNNAGSRAARSVKASRIVFEGIVSSLMILLFITEGSMIGRTSQQPIMEYYIYYRETMAKVLNKERYEFAFATREEAEKARQKAAIDTRGDADGFLANTYIKEVPSGRYTAPLPPTISPAVSPPASRTPTTPTPGSSANERLKELHKRNQDLLKRLKDGVSATALDGDQKELPARLKTGTTTLEEHDVSGRLKGGRSTNSTEGPGLHNERDLQQVGVAISELQTRILSIRSLLRLFSKSLLNNNSELEAWAQTVDQASHDAWESGKDLLKNTFFYYSMLGLEKSVQRGIFLRLDRLINSTDPGERLWLGREILSRHLEFGRVKKIVDFGLIGDGFAELLASDDESLKKSLDALLLVNDLIDASGLAKAMFQGTPAGFYFAIGKTAGEAVAEASAAAYGWFSIDRLTRENEEYARQIELFSNNMEQAEKRMKCLKDCLNRGGRTHAYTEGCLERCQGKTRFITPPPPLK